MSPLSRKTTVYICTILIWFYQKLRRSFGYGFKKKWYFAAFLGVSIYDILITQIKIIQQQIEQLFAFGKYEKVIQKLFVSCRQILLSAHLSTTFHDKINIIFKV